MTGPERGLADVLGGSSGGWAFWLAALAALDQAVTRSREREQAFGSYPPGEFGRFLRDVDEALSLAALAVDVQQLVNGEPDGNHDARRDGIASLLLERARAAGVRFEV